VILLLALLQAAVPHFPNTPQEREYCISDPEGQTEGICLADQKAQRGDRDMAAALAQARRIAVERRREIARFKRDRKATPTLEGDPVKALERSQAAWQRSMSADCLVYALQFATAVTSTVGVTENEDCEANRKLDRARFLQTLAD